VLSKISPPQRSISIRLLKKYTAPIKCAMSFGNLPSVKKKCQKNGENVPKQFIISYHSPKNPKIYIGNNIIKQSSQLKAGLYRIFWGHFFWGGTFSPIFPTHFPPFFQHLFWTHGRFSNDTFNFLDPLQIVPAPEMPRSAKIL